jgi:phospholipase/carboxylesterase
MSNEVLTSIEITPTEPVRAAVIWLHGLGADGSDFEPIVPALGLEGQGVRFVFPNAPKIPVTINAGMVMPAWYDIRSIDLGRQVDEDAVRTSAAQISALIERENARGIPSDRILLAGFSQGGAMALHVGLRHPHALAGILALSCYLVNADTLEAEGADANKSTQVLQIHGSNDPMVRLDSAEASRDRLQELGYGVEWKTYPMGHEVCLEEVKVIGGWLGERLAAP